MNNPAEAFVARVGGKALAFLEELGSLTWLAGNTAAEIGDRVAERRPPFRLADFFFQTARVGVGSLPMVILLSVFVGLTMALLTGYQLQKFGVTTLVPPVVGIAFTREMGPLFTGIVLASRIGAAFTAELGAMIAGGEVDALEAMGIGPLRYLVTPRWLAIFCMTPCLAVLSTLSGICGGAFISDLMLQLGYSFFFDQVMLNLMVKDILAGVFKSFVFGALIGLISCYKGLGVKGGAVGVGVATTSSVVTAVSSVIAFDSVINIFLVLLFP
ncbi:MAG: ABC transporter permease [Methylacidiphilales bacterium]|nr:ABC transporter permease [Candidatus Methylacidiphilales bacterium]